MDKDKVLEYLNTLEISYWEDGEDVALLVQTNEKMLNDLEKLGVNRKEFLRYGDDGEICILSYACDKNIAYGFDSNLKLVKENFFRIEDEFFKVESEDE